MTYLIIVQAFCGTFFFVSAWQWRRRAILAESRLAHFKAIVDEAYREAQEQRERQEMEGTLWPC